MSMETGGDNEELPKHNPFIPYGFTPPETAGQDAQGEITAPGGSGELDASDEDQPVETARPSGLSAEIGRDAITSFDEIVSSAALPPREIGELFESVWNDIADPVPMSDAERSNACQLYVSLMRAYKECLPVINRTPGKVESLRRLSDPDQHTETAILSEWDLASALSPPFNPSELTEETSVGLHITHTKPLDDATAELLQARHVEVTWPWLREPDTKPSVNSGFVRETLGVILHGDKFYVTSSGVMQIGEHTGIWNRDVPPTTRTIEALCDYLLLGGGQVSAMPPDGQPETTE